MQGTPVSEGHIRDLLGSILAVIPDSEEFPSGFVGLAEEAAAAVSYTLECCLIGDVQLGMWVWLEPVEGNRTYLDLVAEPNVSTGRLDEGADRYFEQWIRESPLMRAEVDKQAHDLARLRSAPELDARFLEELRSPSRQAGIQPLLREIVRMPKTPSP